MIPGQTVNQDYQIVRKVGQGSFGYVYEVKHRSTHQLYAIKTDQKSITKMQLENQAQILKEIWSQIHKSASKKQIPETSSQSKKVEKKGFISQCLQYYPLSQQQTASFNKMVLPLLGQNLYNLFRICNKRLDSHTIYQVAVEILKNIEFLHSLGFIHRDIKPQNFVLGNHFDSMHSDSIYLVDFGLGKRYKNKDNEHIPYEIGKRIRGTPMYMSINVILGIQASRRDDLQSLIYIVVLLIKGRLPWHSMKFSKKDFNQLIVGKISLNADQLFQNLPKQLKQTYLYIRRLKFEETPNYQKVYQSLQSILNYKNITVEEEYNGKYRKYCWQYLIEKVNFNSALTFKDNSLPNTSNLKVNKK